MSARMEQDKIRFHEYYEIARFAAVLVINPHLEKPLEDPKQYVEFSWEKPYLPKMQTLEEQKRAVLGIAIAFGAVDKRKKKKDGS